MDLNDEEFQKAADKVFETHEPVLKALADGAKPQKLVLVDDIKATIDLRKYRWTFLKFLLNPFAQRLHIVFKQSTLTVEPFVVLPNPDTPTNKN